MAATPNSTPLHTFRDRRAERMQDLWAYLSVGFALITALMSANYRNSNPDSFWHLKMGKDWLESGLSPWRDHYSFTFPNEALTSVPYLFQGLLYFLSDWLGEDIGLVAIKALAYIALIASFVLYLRTVKAPKLSYLLIFPVLVLALQTRTLVRPELFSYSLMVVGLLFYYRASKRVSFGTMFPIILLMLFWTNYHSAIFGYVIFAGLFLDIGTKFIVQRAPLLNWAGAFAWGVATLAIGFLNPGLSHPVIETLSFHSSWSELIVEYEVPLPLLNSYFSAIVLTMVAMSLLLAVQQRRFGYLLMLFVFLHSASTTVRMVAPASILTIALLGHLVAGHERFKAAESRPRAWSIATRGLGAVIIVASVILSSRTAVLLATNSVPQTRYFPEHLISHIRQHDLHGNLFGEYTIGGFLLNRLAPDSKVYIDGRTQILYPFEFAKAFYRIKGDPSLFIEEAARFDIDASILEVTLSNARNMLYAGFSLEYPDIQYAMFTKSVGRLSTLGQAWAIPYCWDESMLPDSVREAKDALDIAPPDSILTPMAQLIVELGTAENAENALADMNLSDLRTDSSLRFYMYRAMASGQTNRAREAWELLAYREVKDFIARSIIYYKENDFASATAILLQLGRTSTSQLEYVDLQVQYEILSKIMSRGQLGEPGTAYRRALGRSIKAREQDDEMTEINHQMMCPAELTGRETL